MNQSMFASVVILIASVVLIVVMLALDTFSFLVLAAALIFMYGAIRDLYNKRQSH